MGKKNEETPGVKKAFADMRPDEKGRARAIEVAKEFGPQTEGFRHFLAGLVNGGNEMISAYEKAEESAYSKLETSPAFLTEKATAFLSNFDKVENPPEPVAPTAPVEEKA